MQTKTKTQQPQFPVSPPVQQEAVMRRQAAKTSQEENRLAEQLTLYKFM